MNIETVAAIWLIAVAILGALILGDRWPWMTMIGGGILIVIGVTLATGSVVPAIVWFVLLMFGFAACVGADRFSDD